MKMKSYMPYVGALLCGAASIAMLAFSLNASAQEAIRWNVASAYGDNTVTTQNLRLFVDEVNERSQGRLKLSLHHNGTLFKMPEIKRAVQSRQVEIGEILLSAYGNEDPLYEVDGIPTVAQTPEKATKLWELTKPMISARLEKVGVHPLFVHYWPGQGFYSKAPVLKPTDFAGMKQRVYNPSGAQWAKLMGATPVLVQYSEVGQALALGTVNSLFAAPSAVIDSKGWESLSYFYPVGLTRPKNIVLVNNKAFQELPKDLQELVMTAAASAEARSHKMALASEEDAFATLEKNGMKRGEVTPELAGYLVETGKTMIKEWVNKAGGDGAKIIDGLHPGLLK